MAISLRLALEAMKDQTPPLQFERGPKITPEIEALVEESTKDPFLGDIARHKKLSDIVVFYWGVLLVGFAIPRKESDGYWRTGPIYVAPQYRRRGIAKAFVAAFFKDKKGRAYIADNNRGSMAVFESAGFSKTGKSIVSDGERLFEYKNT